MRKFWSTFLLPSLVGVGLVRASAPEPVRNGFYKVDLVDKLRDDTMPNVEAWMARKIAAGTNNNCTLENAAVRREWGDMPPADREDYNRAVNCLMKLPPKSPRDKYPGALNRFDDFVAYHITHAPTLHGPIYLFPAHKYFIYAFETALRDECGYKGYHPYMNYDRVAQDPLNSAMFNGNASSLGGNGEPDPTFKGIRQSGRTPNIIKSGGGGGCVTSGPYSDMVVSLGPVMPMADNIPRNPRRDGLASNPRCLRRDININAALGATADHAYRLLTENTDINSYYNTLLGQPPPKNDPYPWGIHTAGHYIYGVDPGGDASISPGDPAFYFHHGMLDRLWWIWQMQDPDNRLNASPSPGFSGKRGGGDGHSHGKRQNPASAKIDLEWLAPPIDLLEAHDQLGGNGGAFCYIYV